MLSIYQVDTIIDEYGNLVCSFRIEIDFLLICAPYTLYHSTSVEESQCSGLDTKSGPSIFDVFSCDNSVCMVFCK